MRLRGLVVLATVAALLGAPQSASAAANVLDSPAASPTNGTTDTVFRLGVAYDGRFPANSVSATAGGHTVEMAMVAGSSTSGAWEGGLRLPPGTWPVTFAADAERGGDPTLAGPILIVAAATPAPVISVPASAPDLASPAAPDLSSPMAADEPHGSVRDTTDVGDEPVDASAVATPAPAPAEVPAPSGSTSSGEGSPAAPAPAPAPTSAATAMAEATAAGTPASDEPAVAAEPAARAAARDTPSPPPPAKLVTADGSAIAPGGSDAAPAEPDLEEAGGDGVLVDDELVTMSARTTGIWGALLLFVAIGTGFGFLFRRRRRASSEADALIASTEAEVILQRRAVRRGRLRVPDEDPIVASMRLGERDGGHRPPSRRRVGRREDGPD